jgi:lysozyme
MHIPPCAWPPPFLAHPMELSMKISKAGIAMLKLFEGCELKAYICQGGVWSVGYGHTGDHVYPGMEIDERTAEKLLHNDLLKFERAVQSVCDGLSIKQWHFDALVSLAFNIGILAFKSSTLVKLLQAGDFAGAADQFLVWTKAGGRVSKGLKNRRAIERSVFLSDQCLDVS